MLDVQQGFPDSQGKRSVHLGPATDSKPDKSSVTPVNSFQVLYLNRSADIYIYIHTHCVSISISILLYSVRSETGVPLGKGVQIIWEQLLQAY